MKKIFIKILHKLQFLKHVNLIVNIELNKKVFKIPVIEGDGYSNLFISERWMISILELLLHKKEGCFVDVGVNIGQTLLKLKSVQSNREYFGFEPNSFCVHYTMNLIKLNNFKKTNLFPFGVSNKSEIGVLNFYSTGNSDSAASMISDFRPNQRIDRTTYIPLYDELAFSNLIGDGKMGFLKIDVEGAEFQVLESFKGKIAEDKPIILIEILPVYSKENTDRLERQKKVESILEVEKYHLFRLVKTETKIKDLVMVESIGIHSEISACDYICVHESDLDIIKSIQL
ncbi:FkbM family methyltransferase [Vicingaceae bacterium]|nr:FkbM family methyltransferase [Vicingaceae bacterium]MDB4060492.1 FkbM family methyltransferase [Vicingaceae bacterium]